MKELWVMAMMTAWISGTGILGLSGQTSEERQLALIADHYEQWAGSMIDNGDTHPYYYTVTDLDQNGRLEVICSTMQGSGRYSYNTFFEVNENLDGLEECQYRTDSLEGDSEADIVTDSVPVYFDAENSAYYYIFDDWIRNGAAENYENKRALSLRGGRLTEQPLAYRSVIYTVIDGDIEFQPTVTCKNENGEEISEEAYEKIADNVFAEYEKKQARFLWLTFDQEEHLMTERIKLLQKAWEGFGIGEED